MKASEQYFLDVLFILPKKVDSIFKVCGRNCVSIQTNATEQYLFVFFVVLFTVLYKLVLALKSMDDSLVYDHSK